jgi:WD40 repeat protein
MTVRVWNSVSGECELGPLIGHNSWVFSVAFSGNSEFIVSGSLDNTVRVWDAVSGDCVLGPLLGHTMCVYSVSFSADKIVSGSKDKTIRVWDIGKYFIEKCRKKYAEELGRLQMTSSRSVSDGFRLTDYALRAVQQHILNNYVAALKRLAESYPIIRKSVEDEIQQWITAYSIKGEIAKLRF